MTANQIAYNKHLEDVRTHQVQEYETQRSNKAKEAENQRANTLNYQASIYSTQASMRNMDVSAETSRYVASVNSAATLGAAAINAETQRRGQDIAARTAAADRTVRYHTDMARLQEQQRSNISQEKISSARVAIDGIVNGANTAAHLAAAGFIA